MCSKSVVCREPVVLGSAGPLLPPARSRPRTGRRDRRRCANSSSRPGRRTLRSSGSPRWNKIDPFRTIVLLGALDMGCN